MARRGRVDDAGAPRPPRDPLEPARGGAIPNAGKAVPEPHPADARAAPDHGPGAASLQAPGDRPGTARPARASAAANGGLTVSPIGARLLALAFDPDVQPADDPLSERILDAALELAAASGLRHLTMDDVSRRARVGRMTVYRRFGSHAKLIDALAVRECRRCLARIAEALDPETPMDERLAALFTVTLEVIREHPLLERLARVEPEALLRELTRDRSEVF